MKIIYLDNRFFKIRYLNLDRGYVFYFYFFDILNFYFRVLRFVRLEDDIFYQWRVKRRLEFVRDVVEYILVNKNFFGFLLK